MGTDGRVVYNGPAAFFLDDVDDFADLADGPEEAFFGTVRGKLAPVVFVDPVELFLQLLHFFDGERIHNCYSFSNSRQAAAAAPKTPASFPKSARRMRMWE